MIRPSVFLAGLVFGGLPACAERHAADLIGVAPARAPASSARAAPRTGGGGGPGFAAQPVSPNIRDRAAVAEACRRDADRIVLYRDRGQLMREDDSDARIGTDASIYARRMETDRLGRVFERDRIAADCIDQNAPAAPVSTPAPRR